jgi:thiol-disulfide isomerase/thioredoxin
MLKRYILLVLFVVFSVGCDGGGRRAITPGSQAPNIKGTSLSGEPLALDQIKGKVIVVNFLASWCPPCIAELPGLEQLHRLLKEQGGTVVGIAVDDTRENIAEIVGRFGVTFPIIHDEAGSSKRPYEIKGLPETFILDEKHQIVLLPDPEDGTPVVRIVGPREWGSAKVLRSLSALLTQTK